MYMWAEATPVSPSRGMKYNKCLTDEKWIAEVLIEKCNGKADDNFLYIQNIEIGEEIVFMFALQNYCDLLQ